MKLRSADKTKTGPEAVLSKARGALRRWGKNYGARGARRRGARLTDPGRPSSVPKNIYMYIMCTNS